MDQFKVTVTNHYLTIGRQVYCKMKSYFTLIVFINLLNINTLYASESALETCQDALGKGDFSQAVLAVDKNTKDPNAWLCKGRAQAFMQELEAAQQSFEYAISLKPKGLDLISTYMLLGNVQQTRQQNLSAMENYLQALKLSEEQKMPRYIMIAHNLIGEAQLTNRQPEEALQSFQAGEKLAMNDNERADSYEHEVLAYHDLKQLDKAIEYQLKAVLMQQKSGTPEQYAEASLTLGQLFTEQKDLKGAEKTYQRLMQYAKDNGGRFYEAKTALLWAEVKKMQGDNTGAAQLIKQAKAIASDLNDDELNILLQQVSPH